MDQNHSHRSAPPGRVPPEAMASTLVPSPEQLQFARVLGQALAKRWREARVRPVGPLRKTPTTSPGQCPVPIVRAVRKATACAGCRGGNHL